jgi:hypothetical protein
MVLSSIRYVELGAGDIPNFKKNYCKQKFQYNFTELSFLNKGPFNIKVI